MTLLVKNMNARLVSGSLSRDSSSNGTKRQMHPYGYKEFPEQARRSFVQPSSNVSLADANQLHSINTPISTSISMTRERLSTCYVVSSHSYATKRGCRQNYINSTKIAIMAAANQVKPIFSKYFPHFWQPRTG